MVGGAEGNYKFYFERGPITQLAQRDVDSGKAFFNIYFFVHTLLYDFPAFIENPDRVEEILNRWMEGKATKFDRIIINIIRDRLTALGAKDVLKVLKMETDSIKSSEFISSPRKVFSLLTEKNT